jgi:HEAT repeat protein
VNFNSYLKSICDTYAKWWDYYTITDVVGKQRNQQKNHPSLLHLMVETIKEEQGKTQQQETTERLTVLEGLFKYARNHILLIGRPGSGKSTALLRLLLESAEAVIANEAKRNQAISKTSRINEQISILIELRFYQSSIIELIRDFFKRHQLWLEIAEIEKLLFEGKFLLLFDGVNELPSEAARQDLRKFRQDYQQTTPMIFSTRDLGVGGDLGIEKKLQMQPLTETQMRDFVCGYLPEQGEELLKQLSGRLRELGETPLLLVMLCSVFVANQNKVPSNLGSVFRRFTEIYDDKLKQDIPVTDESRFWWKRLLQHLAWVMTHGGTSPQTPLSAVATTEGTSATRCSLEGEGLNSPPSLAGKGVGGLGFLKTEISVAIPIQKARDILTSFLKEQDYHQPRDAEKWLDDLLKYHLIQIGTENQIQFRHQLLQEYYAAERLLEELPKLSDDQLQWEYLNYLKWTETVALMMQLLDVETQNFASLRLVKLALEIDLQLGARLAGEVKEELHEETVELVLRLDIGKLIKIRLLGRTKSRFAFDYLMNSLHDEDFNVRSCTLSEFKYCIGGIKLINLLRDSLEDRDSNVRQTAINEFKKIIYKLYGYNRIDILIDILHNNQFSADIRTNILHTLNAIRISSKNNHVLIIDSMLLALSDEDLEVRYTAASCLKLYSPSIGNIDYSKIDKIIELYEEQNFEYWMKIEEWNKEYEQSLDAAATYVYSTLEDIYYKLNDEYDTDENFLYYELHNNNKYIREIVIKELAKTDNCIAVNILISVLKHKDLQLVHQAASILGKKKSEAAIPGLSKLLKNQKFLQLNNGENSLNALNALEKTQQHLKYYKPIPKTTISESTPQKYDLAAVIEHYLKEINQGLVKMSEQSQNPKYSFGNSESIQIIEQNHGQVIGKNIEANKQSLVEAEKEITELLNQLSQNYPITTEYEKKAFVNQFNQEIKTNSRIKNIILVGGIELIKMICPPLGIPIEMGRKWLETAEKNREI